MDLRVTVALYDRGNLSLGNSRKAFGYEAFHWGIIIIPRKRLEEDDKQKGNKEGQERNCHAFGATDASEINKVTWRMDNPNMDWWLRASMNVDPERSSKLLGCVAIGTITEPISDEDLSRFFHSVPLPVKNTHPQESCVSWAVDAVRAMQRRGWVPPLDIDQLKDWALGFADEKMAKTDGRRKLEVADYPYV